MKTTGIPRKKRLAERLFGLVLAAMMVLTQCVGLVKVSAAAGDAISIGTDASSRIFFTESSEIPEGFDIATAYTSSKLFTVDSLVDGHKAISALNLVMEEGKDLTFTTTVDVQTAGTYLIKTIGSLTTAEALEAVNETNYSLKNEWLTSCTVDVDDTVLGTNAAFSKIGSTGSHFVEKITNGYHQTFTDYTSVLTSQVVELTAGTHTITHKMGERQDSKSYAFVLDFMDIVPVGTVNDAQTTVIPAYYFRPNRMNTIGVVTNADKSAVVTANYTLVVPDYTLTTDLGNGKKIEEKLTAVNEYNTETSYAVTLNVEDEGVYNIKYFVSPSSGWQSGAKAWLDQAAEEACQVQSLPCATLDYGWDAYGVKATYNHNQFQPNCYTQQVFLTKGAHTLNLEFETMSSGMCVYTFDRIEVSSVVPAVKETDSTRVFFAETSEIPEGFDIATEYTSSKLFTVSSLVDGHNAMSAINFAMQDDKDLSFATTVNVKTAGTYLIRTIGAVTVAEDELYTWLTSCAVDVDGKQLPTNPTIMSDVVNEYYTTFNGATSVLTSQAVYLTEGTHTITHNMGSRGGTRDIYAFTLDFMDIVPLGVVEAGLTTVIPAYYLNPANGLGNSLVVPDYTLTTDLGRGNKIEEKLTAVHLYGDGEMVDYSIAVDVKDAGMYNISYLVSPSSSWQSVAKMWLDEDTEAACEVQSFPSVALDYQWTGNGTGYAYSDFQPNRYTQQTFLTEGSHTINIHVEDMENGFPIFTFDRIEIALASVPTLEDGVRIEAEYFGSWSDDDNVLMTDAANDGLSDKMAKEMKTYTNEEGETVTYTMYVMSEDTSKYDFEIGAAVSNSVNQIGWLSRVEMLVNGESLGYLGEAMGTLGGKVKLDSSDPYVTNGDHRYYTYVNTEGILLNAGLNKIQFRAIGRDEGGFIFGLDYIETTEYAPGVYEISASMYAGSVADANRITRVQNGDLIAKTNLDGLISETETYTVYFAIYEVDENGKKLAELAAQTVDAACKEVCVTISDFKAEEGKEYEAKVFAWDENLRGEGILLTVEQEDFLDFTVEVEEGREIVILQLTDTQIIDSSQERYEDRLLYDVQDYWGPDKMEERCFGYLRETIEATKPDLILMTGDNVYGEFDDAGTSFEALFEFMESFDIPWAPVFGNHDNESIKGAEWQCDMFENAENCLFKRGDVSGYGNYTIGVTQGGELKRVFFMMDTRCREESNWERGFAEDQIDWFVERGKLMKQYSPEINSTFAIHIQPYIFKAALSKYGFTNSGTKENPINIDTLSNKENGDFGYLGGNMSQEWDQDFTVYNHMKDCAADSILVGHVHVNSASVVYDGVRFQYGQKSSTYDQANYIKEDGTVVGSYTEVGTPIVGGNVMKLSEADGTISEAYIYYCE